MLDFPKIYNCKSNVIITNIKTISEDRLFFFVFKLFLHFSYQGDSYWTYWYSEKFGLGGTVVRQSRTM